MSLWYPQKRVSLKIKLIPIPASELEESIKKAQLECDHAETFSFGPSYMLRSDGSWRLFDASVCSKCGYEVNNENKYIS